LDTANDLATSRTAAKQPGLHFLYADLSNVLRGATPGQSGGSQPNSLPNSLKQTIIGNDLLPYVDQAVNDELTARGLQGSQDIPPFTPTSQWKLIVQVPLELQAGPQHLKSNSGANTPPGTTPRFCMIGPVAGGAVPAGSGVCRQAGNGVQLTGNNARPVHRRPIQGSPVIPAPPAPLPKPISLHQTPTTGTSPGGSAGTNPAPGTGTSALGTGTSSSGTGTSSVTGTTSSGGGTTASSGGGSTSGGGTASGGGSTSGGGSGGGGTS
jgi:hypothetical protein